MPSTREIRRRIRSVRSTAQITKAMEMVAAARMRRAQQRVLASRPYAERMRAAKRGGGQRPVPLHEVEDALRSSGDLSEVGSEALLALDDSLRRLEKHDRRQSRIVECRFFGGMSIEETAEALGISPATVSRGWAMAQAWLYRDLRQALGDAQ